MHQIGMKVKCKRCPKKFKKKTRWHEHCSRKCSNETQTLERAAELEAAKKPVESQ